MRAHTPPAFAVETSDNAKIGPVSATYVAQDSCPPSCPLRGVLHLVAGAPPGWQILSTFLLRIRRSK
jgi:hypothetical protein